MVSELGKWDKMHSSAVNDSVCQLTMCFIWVLLDCWCCDALSEWSDCWIYISGCISVRTFMY